MFWNQTFYLNSFESDLITLYSVVVSITAYALENGLFGASVRLLVLLYYNVSEGNNQFLLLFSSIYGVGSHKLLGHS